MWPLFRLLLIEQRLLSVILMQLALIPLDCPMTRLGDSHAIQLGLPMSSLTGFWLPPANWAACSQHLFG